MPGDGSYLRSFSGRTSYSPAYRDSQTSSEPSTRKHVVSHSLREKGEHRGALLLACVAAAVGVSR